MRAVSLKRKTPLARGTSQLKRTPLAPGCKPMGRTPINPVSTKRRHANRQRMIVVSALRLLMEGCCARCGRSNVVVHGHERLARSHGGDILAPDCLLCNSCNSWAEDQPRMAALTGWKISGKWAHDPHLEVGQAIDLTGNLVTFVSDYPLAGEST